jgi:molybdenum cofactor biosynthesis enzyme MoaA
MANIDTEIQELKARWAREAAEQKQRAADAQMARLEAVRDRLRSGEMPLHACLCTQCLRARLTCDPALVCEQGTRDPSWWGDGPRKPRETVTDGGRARKS